MGANFCCIVDGFFVCVVVVGVQPVAVYIRLMCNQLISHT